MDSALITLTRTLSEPLEDVAEALEHLARDLQERDAQPLVARAARLRRRRIELRELAEELGE